VSSLPPFSMRRAHRNLHSFPTRRSSDLIHFDVMDNHYVPNLSVGPMVCEAVRPHVTIPIDVHLMVSPVDRIVGDFARAGANLIRSEEHTSELQSRENLVCRLLLEKKKKK